VNDLVLRLASTDVTNKVTFVSHRGIENGRLVGVNIKQQGVVIHPDFHKHYLPSDTTTWNIDAARIDVTRDSDITKLKAFFTGAKLDTVRYPTPSDRSGIEVIGFDPVQATSGPQGVRTAPRFADEFSTCDADQTVKWVGYEDRTNFNPGSGSIVLVGGDLYGIYLGYDSCRQAQSSTKCHFALRTESTVSGSSLQKRGAPVAGLACDLAPPTHQTTLPVHRWMTNQDALILILVVVVLACTHLIKGYLWLRRKMGGSRTRSNALVDADVETVGADDTW
jgi:hypothetical protein